MAIQNETSAMVKAILATSSILELADVINNDPAIFPLDAKTAYGSLQTGTINETGKALAKIFVHIADLYEKDGKPAGVSTVYNVLDARIVRKVRFSKKLAINLKGSKALAEFIGYAGNCFRSTKTRTAKSVNGNEFQQNRNAYHMETLNKAGKQTRIRKPQFSIKVLGTILANLACGNKLALPPARVRGNENSIPTMGPIEIA